MRINLPVTTQEFPFPSGQTLVSTTDDKGRILYCNPAFIAVSGYEKQELLGQPHNLIRHPDMPEEAFRDMWATISSGRPWSAPVKNRRKNGDYYWVMANATPLLENGRPVGYMSVRTEATREQIQSAERLYAQMREEKSQGRLVHALRKGRLVRNTLWGRTQEALRPGMAAKMLLTHAGSQVQHELHRRRGGNSGAVATARQHVLRPGSRLPVRAPIARPSAAATAAAGRAAR